MADLLDWFGLIPKKQEKSLRKRLIVAVAEVFDVLFPLADNSGQSAAFAWRPGFALVGESVDYLLRGELLPCGGP